MITLITGAPRSGKTLYTVDKLIPPEIGRVVDIEDDNGPRKVTRRVLCNINQLQLEHEQVDVEWLQKLADVRQVGDFIVFDEVQRVWPNRPTGSKIPPSVEYLQTHGHDAVDLVILTQSPMLIDPGVRALVGRHLHVRKVGGLGAAVIYEWDACSNALNFKNAFKKTAYKYSAKARALYKSAKGHTGSRASLPFALWLFLAAIAGAAYAWPTLMDRITARAQNPAMLTKDAPGALPGSPATSPLPLQQTQPEAPILPTSERPLGPMAEVAPQFSGCIVAAGYCLCYDTTGAQVDGDLDECKRADKPAPARLALADGPTEGGRPSTDEEADFLMIRATTKRPPLPSIRF